MTRLSRRHVLAGGLTCWLTVVAFAQQRDSRTVPAPEVSTAVLSGVVMSADSPPVPVRRAIVSVTGDPLDGGRSAITDDAGRFSFSRLPAGAYAVTAKKAAYLTAEFGSTKPGRPGSRVALAVGEKRAIALTLFKGAAIGGTLRDSNGKPVAGVPVIPLNVRSPRPGILAETATTNDRGEYRIYGLMPGEYLVVASPSVGGAGEMGARTPAEMDAVLAALAQRQSGSTSAAPAARPAPMREPRPVSYAPTYYPGTPLLTGAERIRLAAGEDRRMDVEVTRVPVASIEGTVSGNVPNLAAVMMAINTEMNELRFGGGPGAMPAITFVPPNEMGEFKYGNLTPGKYQIIARVRGGGPAEAPAPGARGRAGGGGGAGGPAPAETMFAVADVDIRGQDVKGVNLALQPGGSMSGKVVFDSGGAPVPTDFARIRIALSLADRGSSYQTQAIRIGNILGEGSAVGINPDGTFQLSAIGPGRFGVTVTLPPDLTPIWKVRSAIVEGRDIMDLDVTGPNVQLRDVVVTLSDKRTELAGRLLSESGQPVTDHYVVVFSADRAHWRVGSRRRLSARPATDGRFVISDLPAGEYLVAALTDLEPIEWQEPAFLEQVAPAAIRIRIAEGEKKTQDLKIK
jgi:uncharacterized protein (DUF2141 family)